MLKVSWCDEPELTISTVDELDRLLDKLQKKHKESPVLVDVELADSGDTLSIGIGRTESVLNFVSVSGDPPYWASLGNHKEDEGVVFNYMGELSELPVRNLISMALARQAMREFTTTGKLPKTIAWEES